MVDKYFYAGHCHKNLIQWVFDSIKLNQKNCYYLVY